MPRPPSDTNLFSSLLQIVADLRGPEGCPWDKEQTHQSLSPYTIEEAYELADVLDSFQHETGNQPQVAAPKLDQSLSDLTQRDLKAQDPRPQDPQLHDPQLQDAKLKDELGDLLFQVALHSQLAAERQAFTMADVIQNLNEKLIRRHPHVFSELKVKNIDEVWTNWEKIKSKEKGNSSTSSIFDFPKNLPALQRAYKIGVKTQKRHFDWPDFSSVQNKFHEEWAEFQQAYKANDKIGMMDELGDVLFTVAQMARHLEFEPEQALRGANHKFESRFDIMMTLVAERKLDWTHLSNSEKESLWSEAKKHFKNKHEIIR